MSKNFIIGNGKDARSENRHYTKKWKKKRKNHEGDRCDNAKCGICAPHKHKSMGNSKKAVKKKYQLKEIYEFSGFKNSCPKWFGWQE